MNFTKPIEIPTKNVVKMHIVGITWDNSILKLAPSLLERGWGNGYVRLPKNHKYFGADYDDIPYDIHRGLSYADYQTFNGIEYYVIGFDTSHYGDNQSMDKQWVTNETHKLQLQAIKDLI